MPYIKENKQFIEIPHNTYRFRYVYSRVKLLKTLQVQFSPQTIKY